LHEVEEQVIEFVHIQGRDGKNICMLVTSSAHLVNCLNETVAFFNSETPLALMVQG
jgi:hypothetical protein